MDKMHSIFRITVYADGSLENRLLEKFLELGAKGYTVVDGRGVGTRRIVQNPLGRTEVSRIELLVHRDVGQRIINYLNRDIIQKQPVTVCVDEVKVIRDEHF